MYKFIIVWRNLYSGDTGFVAHIRKDHFENTFAVKEARMYPSEIAARKAIMKIQELPGEIGKANEFQCVAYTD